MCYQLNADGRTYGTAVADVLALGERDEPFRADFDFDDRALGAMEKGFFSADDVFLQLTSICFCLTE
ncbi:MAG: hypothetical protein ACJ8J7_10095 [Sulfurifustaceae bacterium]